MAATCGNIPPLTATDCDGARHTFTPKAPTRKVYVPRSAHFTFAKGAVTIEWASAVTGQPQKLQFMSSLGTYRKMRHAAKHEGLTVELT